MNRDLYEIIALAARYGFVALMLLIVARAWRITLVDSRRAATLRRLSPSTGVCGEFLVVRGDGRAPRGMRYPVIREGMIGSSSRADVRVRHPSVRRRHAYFQMTDAGLHVRSHASAPLRDRHGAPVRELTLVDGSLMRVGDVRLMLILTDATAAEESFDFEAEDAPFGGGDDLFDIEDPFNESR